MEKELNLNTQTPNLQDELSNLKRELEAITKDFAVLKREIKLTKNYVKESHWLWYYALHKSMEDALRKKAQRGEKIRIVFMISEVSGKFESKSVYDAMKDGDVFEPIMLIVHVRDKYLNDDEYKDLKKEYNLMLERGYNAVFGYDENKRPIGLSSLRPDIVFDNNPNRHHNSHYNNMVANMSYLTCYIQYGYNVVNSFTYHYENNNIGTCWKVFVPTYFDLYMHNDYHGIRAALDPPEKPMCANTILTGYPKMDAYVHDEGDKCIPNKFKNGNPIIIYAPHWTVGVNLNFCSFDKYYENLLNLVKNNPDINFVFKPHPGLPVRIKEIERLSVDCFMTYNQYCDYLDIWDSLPNGAVIEDGEYINLFKRSSGLITDSGSFVAEYLPSGNPCIYLLNGKEHYDKMNAFGRKILNGYYCCYDWNEVLSEFKKVIIEGNDTKKDLRIQTCKEDFINIGTAGKIIVEHIEDVLNIKIKR